MALAALAVLAGVAVSTTAIGVDRTADMAQPTYAAAAGTIDGVHYIAGGLASNRIVVDSVRSVDPTTGEMRLVGTLPLRIFQSTGAASGGRLFVFGGADEGAVAQRNTYAFDPDTGAVDRVVSATFARGTIGAAAVAYGSSIFVAGGFDLPASDDNAWSDRIWRFDPATGELEAASARLPTGRAYMAAATDGDVVWFIGGYGVSPDARCGLSICTLDSVLEFDPRAETVREIATLPAPLRWAGAVYDDGLVHVLGGCNGNCGAWGASDRIVVVDPATGDATVVPPKLPDRTGRFALFRSGSTAYVVGGAYETAGNEQPVATIDRVRLGVTAPWPPSGLTVRNTPDGVNVRWNATAYDGGAGAVRYEVLRAPIGGPLQRLDTVDAREYLDRDAPGGTTVEYAVRSIGGTGLPSTSTPRASILPRRVPGAPADVIAQGGDGKVVLQWLPPAGTAPGDVRDYRISCGDCPADLQDLLVNGTRTSTLLQPLDNGATYTLSVRAINDQGEGPPTPQVTATPSPVPDPPTRLRARPGNTSVELSWAAPPASIEVHGYRVLRGTSLAELETIAEVGVDATTYDDADAPRGRSVLYAVAALRNGEASPYSNVVRSGLPNVPGAPDAAWARAEGTGVLIGWTPPLDDGGSPVIAYEVHRDGPDVGDWVRIAQAPPVVDDEAPTAVNLTYRVRAVNSAGPGPAATTAPVRVDGVDERTPPTPLLAVEPSSGTTETVFAFDASGSSDDDGVVAYRFDFGDGTGTGWTPIATAQHRYSAPGEYAASVSVRDVLGVVSTDPAVKFVGVGVAPEPPAPPEGGPPEEGNGLPGPGPLLTVLAVAGALAVRAGVRRRVR